MAKAKYKKGADGYFQARVWDGTYTELGKKKYISIRSKKSSKDLENKVAEYNQRIKDRSLVKHTDMTFLEYAQLWRTIYKATRSGNTQAMYENIIEKHFVALSSLPLQDVSRIHYQILINNAEGHPRTQQQIKVTFKQVIKSAIADQHLPARVLDDIFNNIDTIRYTPKEKRALTSEEKEALFKAELSPKDRAFVYILYGCGLRRGEALALTRFNIDLERRNLTVNQALAYDHNNPYVKETKSNNGIRSVPIPAKVFPAIESYVRSVHNDKLFYMKDGGWITKSSYDKMWARIVKAMQEQSEKPVIGLTAHIFRHNYCTNLCYQIPAISIKKIAELLGDTEKMVIEVYNHMILEKEDAVSAVENALNF